MSALEFMEKQLLWCKRNFEREAERGAPQETLDNIGRKIGYYTEAVRALRERERSEEAR